MAVFEPRPSESSKSTAVSLGKRRMTTAYAAGLSW